MINPLSPGVRLGSSDLAVKSNLSLSGATSDPSDQHLPVLYEEQSLKHEYLCGSSLLDSVGPVEGWGVGGGGGGGGEGEGVMVKLRWRREDKEEEEVAVEEEYG